MAARIGFGYGYITQLRNGQRTVHTISDDFAQRCATYLGVPRMQVLMLAGRVTAEDLFDSRDAFQQDVTRAMDFISADPKWGYLITAVLRRADFDSQFAVVRLYEAATGSVLMPTHREASSLLAQVLRVHQDTSPQAVPAAQAA